MTSTTEYKQTPLALLRAKLGQKAKLEPKFRFYTLYHHISRDDVLQEAWQQVKRNGGAAGIDKITIKSILASGPAEFLEQIKQELRSKTYHPSPVKRVYIPKSDGKLRPLGIPTVKDRIVQAALLLIIEPIFEADFLDCSYGFRPEKSAHQAVTALKKAISEGKTHAYDADLKGYFDSIPHDKLMKAIEYRIVDAQVLKLIRKWLQAPIWEPGKPMSKNDKGTPQGGIISPLLANIYLHWFDKLFYSESGPSQWAKAVLVRYADDFVIVARYMTCRTQAWIERQIEGRFGLAINREKTKIVNLSQTKAELSFLGFTMRRVPLRNHEWRSYCLITPSKKKLKAAKSQIRELTSPKLGFQPAKQMISRLNRYLSGWGQYFSYGNPSKAFDSLNGYIQDRVYHFMQRRSQRGYRRKGDNKTWYQEFQSMGLITLTKQYFRVNA